MVLRLRFPRRFASESSASVGESQRLPVMFTASLPGKQIVFVYSEVVYPSLRSGYFHNVFRRARVAPEPGY